MATGDQDKGIGSGGMMMLYGVMIGDALRAKGVTLPELVILRDQVQAVVSAQGNLLAGLGALEAEIAQRSVDAGIKGEPPAATAVTSPRFVLQLLELDLPASDIERIEKRIGELALEELAKLDTRGDYALTPLSGMKAWGGGWGGHTAGMVAQKR
jgi:hypothetical protein